MAEADEAGAGKKLRDALKRVRDAVGLLPADPEGFKTASAACADQMRSICGEFGQVDLAVSTNRILLGEDPVYKSESRANNLAFDLFRQGVRRLSFRPGATNAEFETFLACLATANAATMDDDFVTAIWRADLAHIKPIILDGYTDKIFMADERFVADFLGAIEAVAPGLVGMAEDDVGDRRKRIREPLDAVEMLDEAEIAGLKNRQDLEAVVGSVLDDLGRVPARPALDHLVRLLASFCVKDPSPLPDGALGDYIARVMVGYVEHGELQAFAEASRSWAALAASAQLFDEPLATRISTLPQAFAGRAVAAAVAHHLDRSQGAFIAWAMWHFANESALLAPDLLATINGCANPVGTAFLKRLLKQQSTSSLDPWAERLRDPNPGVVLEVLDVILHSDLGDAAKPLLLEVARHESAAVRARAIEGLEGGWDLQVREVLLPLLMDTEPTVRLAVIHAMAESKDSSVAPHIARAIKSSAFFGFGDDEQRTFFEALARLGGPPFLAVFKEQLRLDESAGGVFSRLFKGASKALRDDATRRGAVSGLALLDVPEARALLKLVQGRAELDLANHCELVQRMARSGQTDGRPKRTKGRRRRKEKEAEDAEELDTDAGRDSMGEGQLFDPAILRELAPTRPRPQLGGAEQSDDADRADDVPLSERPLLGEGEVFLPQDQRALKAEPAAAQGPRFAVSQIHVVLVGVAQEQAPMRAVATVAPVVQAAPRPTAAAPQQSSSPKAAPAEVAGSLEDLLKGYLVAGAPKVEESAAPATGAAPRPATTELPNLQPDLEPVASPIPELEAWLASGEASLPSESLPDSGSLPFPPGMDGLPPPPGMDALPAPAGMDGLPLPPGMDELPAPPSLDELPAPPSLDELPAPPSLDELPAPPSSVELSGPSSSVELSGPSSSVELSGPSSSVELSGPSSSVELSGPSSSVELSGPSSSVELSGPSSSVELSGPSSSVEQPLPLIPELAATPEEGVSGVVEEVAFDDALAFGDEASFDAAVDFEAEDLGTGAMDSPVAAPVIDDERLPPLHTPPPARPPRARKPLRRGPTPTPERNTGTERRTGGFRRTGSVPRVGQLSDDTQAPTRPPNSAPPRARPVRSGATRPDSGRQGVSRSPARARPSRPTTGSSRRTFGGASDGIGGFRWSRKHATEGPSSKQRPPSSAPLAPSPPAPSPSPPEPDLGAEQIELTPTAPGAIWDTPAPEAHLVPDGNVLMPDLDDPAESVGDGHFVEGFDTSVLGLDDLFDSSANPSLAPPEEAAPTAAPADPPAVFGGGFGDRTVVDLKPLLPDEDSEGGR